MKKTLLLLACGLCLLSTRGAFAENISLTCKFSDGSGQMQLDISEDRVMLDGVVMIQVKDIKIGDRYITFNSTPSPSDNTSEEFIVDRSTGTYTDTTIWPNNTRRHVHAAACEKSDTGHRKF